MAENETTRITDRELREAELQMTGRPPASATGFIGFVPDTPATSDGASSNGTAGSNAGSGAAADSSEADSS